MERVQQESEIFECKNGNKVSRSVTLSTVVISREGDWEKVKRGLSLLVQFGIV